MDTPEQYTSIVTETSEPAPPLHTILQFVREPGTFDPVTNRRTRGNPRGVIVADFDKETNTINVGWSFVCKKKNAQGKVDNFDKNLGLRIATNRMLLEEPSSSMLPRSVETQLLNVVEQTAKYFKVDTFRVKVNGEILPVPYKLVID